MLWLYLLGIATALTIALRRVTRRLKPLDDELYAKNVAIEQLQSGVAWVRADGTFGSANQSFAKTLKIAPAALVGKEWYKMFPPEDHSRIHEFYSQTLLSGVTSFDARGLRPDGSTVWLNVRLAAVHDHDLRFVGHHCLIEDRTREHELELQLKERDTLRPLAAMR